MRVVSWNVNGIRAGVRCGFVDFVDRSGADIVGVQEVRARLEDIPPAARRPPGCHTAFTVAERHSSAEHRQRGVRRRGVRRMHARRPILRALAAELALKAIASKVTGTHERGHDLLKLFDGLDQSTRDCIEATAARTSARFRGRMLKYDYRHAA